MEPLENSPITRDGRMLILAYDHGLEHGPGDFDRIPRTANPGMIFDLAAHEAVTGLAVGKGVAESFYPSYEDDVALIAKLNGTSNLWTGEPDSAVNWSIGNAREIGADAVGFTLYPGSNNEVEMAEEFRDIHEGARNFDLPVVVWSYPRGQGVKNDTSRETIAYAARVALELGADVAKVKYPGSVSAWEWVLGVAGPVDVVVSGGPRVSDRAFLERVRTVVDAGGAGVAVGRNVWQRDDPESTLAALGAIVHEDATVEEALERL